MTREQRRRSALALRGRRERLKLGVEEVATGLGVDRSTVWRWESGRAVPSLVAVKAWTMLLALARSERRSPA